MKSGSLRQLGVVAIVTLFLLAAFRPVAATTRWPDWAEEVVSGACIECYDQDDAVVVLDEWNLKLRGGDRRGTRRRVVHIFNEEGIEAAHLFLANNSFRQNKKVRVWVRLPGGETQKYSDEDGTILSAGNSNVLDDTQILVIDPPGLVPGTTVAVEVTLFRSAEWPQDLFSLQGKFPVAKVTIAVDKRQGWRVDSDSVGNVVAAPSESPDEDRWEFTKLPALPRGWRGYAPVPPSAMLSLRYVPTGSSSPFQSWNSTAEWFRDKFRLTEDSGTHLDALLEEVRRSDGDPVELSGRISRRLRYFAIELGWGGYVPRQPSVTLRRDFGDCKDKTQLMLALLEALDIEAYPALAVAASANYVPEDLPGPELFNHVIAAIPWADRERHPGMTIVEDPTLGPIRLFDPTLPEGSAMDIGMRLEGGTGLILHPAVQGVVRFPSTGVEDNIAEERNRVRIDSGGLVDFRSLRLFSGALRQTLEADDGSIVDSDELRRKVFPDLALRDPGLRDFSVGEVEQQPGGEWTYEVRYRSPALLARFGELRLLELGSLVSTAILPTLAKAEETVFMPLRASIKDSYELEMNGWLVVNQIEPFRIQNSVGSVQVSVTKSAEGISVSRTIVLEADRVSPENRVEIRELRDGLRRANGVAVAMQHDPSK